MRRYWVYCIGTAEWSPPEDWLARWGHHTHEMWFPPTKRPAGVSLGDRAVIHGSGGCGFLAAAEVTSSEPEPNRTGDPDEVRRWPWVLPHKLLVAILADSNAPSLDDVGWDNPRRLRRNPHVEIDRDTYERIANAVVDGARRAVAV